MKALKLSVSDRFCMSGLLPQAGGKIEMILIESILKKVEFLPEEITKFGMKDNGDGGVTWTSGKPVEFEFTDEQVEVLKSASKRVDDEKKITRENLSLIQKIDSL